MVAPWQGAQVNTWSLLAQVLYPPVIKGTSPTAVGCGFFEEDGDLRMNALCLIYRLFSCNQGWFQVWLRVIDEEL